GYALIGEHLDDHLRTAHRLTGEGVLSGLVLLRNGVHGQSLAAWRSCTNLAILKARTPLLASTSPTLKAMRHIIGILLQNEAGALARVAGMFSSRGYNIESLSVAATDDPALSRITLVTKGSEAVVQQIVNQLNRLIDVVAVDDMTGEDHLERELALIKLRVRPSQ